MPDTYVQRLEFAVSGASPDAFIVFRVSGREAISELFRFEIDAISDDPALAASSTVGANASLTLARAEQTRKIHGMVETIELHGITPQGQYVYRVTLVPRLQRLAMSRQNQIHGTTAPVSIGDILADELTASALKGPAVTVSGRLGLGDFDLRLTQTYPLREYVVQYDESDLAFVSRQCEHYGIFYFFTHDDGRDVVVFGDSRIAFPHVGGPASVPYRTASGLANPDEAAVFRFVSRLSMVPARVCLRDYNYRRPDLMLEVDEAVDPEGHGVVVDYGSHFRKPKEGKELARVRAQELASRKLVFEGASDSVHLAAGAVFDLTDHFHSDFNAGYLITWIEHEATQALPGLAEFAGPGHQTSYRNRFEALPKTVEFRPARKTPKPKMPGLSNAIVDASGSGQRAELDEFGRYKVRQQFDQRAETSGQASRYMRKAEPYGGAGTGMHFPLLKGAEVVLACVNGDPDRPIIVGVMQNKQYASVVNSRNATKNRLRTTSGTLFEIDDGPAGGAGGGIGAVAGANLAPQRALAGPDPAPSPTSEAPRSNQPLYEQRAEADVQTTAAGSPYARLHVTGTGESYWRLGEQPPFNTTMPVGQPRALSEEETLKSRMTVTGIPSPADRAPGTGVFLFTAGDQTSLIRASSYSQIDGSSIDYVKNTRRVISTDHSQAVKNQFQLYAARLTLETTKGTVTDNSAAGTAQSGELRIRTAGNLTQSVGGKFNQSVDGDGITRTSGMKVTQTWGATSSFMMGSAIAMVFGLDLKINLSAAILIQGALKMDVIVGMQVALRFGWAMEFFTSPKVDLNATFDMKATPGWLNNVATKIQTSIVEAKQLQARLDQAAANAKINALIGKVTTADVTV